MKKLGILALSTIGALLTANVASAKIEEQIKNFRGIRSSGMGGVIATTGSFAEALFGNPARLSAVDVSRWSLLDITSEINSNLISDMGTVGDLFGSSGNETISTASSIIGRNEHFRAQILAGYFNPHWLGNLGFGFALISSTQANILVNYTTDIDAQVISDAGPVVGFSYPFLNRRLLVGQTFKFLYRAGFDEHISALDFATGREFKLSTFGKQGVGIDTDLGAYYRVPWEPPFMRVAVGATVNNLFKSHYDELESTLLSDLGPRPPNNDRTLSFGLRFDFPDTGWFRSPLVAIELQDVGSTTHHMSFMKRLHVGTENRLGRYVALRAGINQGYLTAGIGLDLPVLKLDLATYGEELSASAGEYEDRRFMFRMAFEL